MTNVAACHASLIDSRSPVGDAGRAFFQANGYLQVDDVADPVEVDRMKSILAEMFARKIGLAEGAQFNLVGSKAQPDDVQFPQIINPHNYAAELRRTRYCEAATAIAREILGPQARFADDHVLMKPALVGPVTPWHQDEAFRDPKFHYNEISIWLALQPVDRNNGCMEFIPGTNLGEVLLHRSPNNDLSVHALECHDGFDPADAVAVPLRAGSCTVHGGRTLHCAGANRSMAPRFAYVMIFNVPPVPVSSPREFPWLTQRRTDRDDRAQQWRSRGGMAVELWRWAGKIDLRDRTRLAYDLKRAVRGCRRAVFAASKGQNTKMP